MLIDGVISHLNANRFTLANVLHRLDREALHAALKLQTDERRQEIFDLLVDVMSLDVDDALEVVWPE